MSETQLREQLARFSRRIWDRGWVANHDGNLSARLSRGRVMCTPTGLSKAEISASMMIIVDGASGKVVSGRLRPFSELTLHQAYYQARPDVGAVIHSHAPTATGLALAGRSLEPLPLPEAVVSLGPGVPTIPPTMPGQDAVSAIQPYLADHDALLLAGNGVLTCGDDLEQAYLRMELVEHLCKISVVAHQLGGAAELPSQWIPTLLAARKRAGLGPEARGAVATPAPGGAAEEGGPSQRQLEQLVHQEISRVLGPK